MLLNAKVNQNAVPKIVLRMFQQPDLKCNGSPHRPNISETELNSLCFFSKLITVLQGLKLILEQKHDKKKNVICYIMLFSGHFLTPS